MHIKTTPYFCLMEKVSEGTKMCPRSQRILPVLNTSLPHLKYGNYVLIMATIFLVQQLHFQYDLAESYLRTSRMG